MKTTITKKYTINEVAEILGISKQRVSQIINGYKMKTKK
jgi:plasmid maintenance system antidote protein VapI